MIVSKEDALRTLKDIADRIRECPSDLVYLPDFGPHSVRCTTSLSQAVVAWTPRYHRKKYEVELNTGLAPSPPEDTSGHILHLPYNDSLMYRGASRLVTRRITSLLRDSTGWLWVQLEDTPGWSNVHAEVVRTVAQKDNEGGEKP